jgi:hypothetical protein
MHAAIAGAIREFRLSRTTADHLTLDDLELDRRKARRADARVPHQDAPGRQSTESIAG